jgi:alkanesulfonate monooxygenase SsuD/methylene tetrahydromethanopterin reductase-like flavin-dependent oxidoreductase (luciferase family)
MVRLILPSYASATTASIDAGSETAAVSIVHSVFTTDHILVEPSERSSDYFNTFDSVVTLAHIAASSPPSRVGVSAVVVPMRNAITLAKDLATIDALSGGRLIVRGVWRGAGTRQSSATRARATLQRARCLLEEAITIWRQLLARRPVRISRSVPPLRGGPFRPATRAGQNLMIWFGGRD